MDAIDPDSDLDKTSDSRYSRQILFPGIGTEGQRRLAAAHVAIVGCGATGAAAAALLARAGIGTLTLIDRDFVEPSNLQRQMLFDETDARDALPKAEAARRQIGRFSAHTIVLSHIADLVPANIHQLLTPAHLVLDGTDNFETRYLLNDYAVQQAKPWIYAAAIGAYAATMNILPAPTPVIPSEAEEPPHLQRERSDVLPSLASSPTPCLSCLFPTPPTGQIETCDTAGILATAVNLAASLQVTEALKYLTGQAHLMRRTFLSFDLWTNQRSEIAATQRDPNCTVCAQRTFTHLAGAARPHITLCGRNSVQIHEHHRTVDLAALAYTLAHHPDVQELRANGLLLRFRRDSHTLTFFADGRAIIQGTTDPTLARSLYARFLGQ